MDDVVRRDKVVEITATCTLTPSQNVVHFTANTATDDYTVYLPSVAEAAGCFLSCRATIANSKTVTVTDLGDDSQWTDQAMATDTDGFLAYCDGFRWWLLVDDVA